MNFSTIAALSTPHGKGGVAVLRMSGADSLAIAGRIFRPRNGKTIEDFSPRYQIYGDIFAFDSEKILDDGLLTYFKAPASFTGEDVVEIACHGGQIITSMVLSALLEAGAQMAKPGEFSRRAFMNGKLSLTSAEGIADLLDAKTEEAALLSSKTARGKLSEEICETSDRILAVAASLWAYLDYPEEDLQSMTDEEMLEELSSIRLSCEKLLRTFDMGRAINSGVSAVIVGKPNVGKSTFFNALLGEDRAIVTDIPGTTRDVIEYPLKAGRVLVNLSDTAGVRKNAADTVEEIGIGKALSAIEEAELVFAIFDVSRPFEEDDRIVLEAIRKNRDRAVILPILMKNDLEKVLDLSQFPFAPEEFFRLSKDERDFSGLIEKIESAFIRDEGALREGKILTNARQKSNLVKVCQCLEEVEFNISSGAKDLATLSLESALASLLEIDGKSAGDKILDEVFSRFCIGK